MHGAILAPMTDATTNPTTASGPRLDASSLEDASVFVRAAGLILEEVTDSRVTGHLQLGPDHLTPWGIVHGGVYCAIVESLSSVCGHTWLSENGGGTVVGVNNNTDFLRAISAGTVYAVATPVHRGRRQQLWVTTITDDNDRVIARGQVRLQNLADT